VQEYLFIRIAGALDTRFICANVSNIHLQFFQLNIDVTAKKKYIDIQQKSKMYSSKHIASVAPNPIVF